MGGCGGTEKVVHSLSKLLASADRQVVQATFDAPGARRYFDSDTPVYHLGPIPRLPLPLRILEYAVAALRLRRLKKELDIDVTVSNLWRADLINFLAGGVGRKIALCHINVIGNPSNRLMVRLRPAVANIYRQFDRVVAVSESLAGELKALYRLPPDQIVHIDNFVDRPDTHSKLPNDGITRFVWCGRLNTEKNVSGLLHAWAGFAENRSGLQLVLLGDGPLGHELADLAASLKLSVGEAVEEPEAEVVFLGRVPNPADHMVGARALLLSSYAEGLPMVVLEALSLGLPVIASDCRAGGVRTALLGKGTCNPNRTEIEFTPAGALLPVPAPESPATVDLWREALQTATENSMMHSAWKTGALERADNFSSQAVKDRWLQAIDFGKLPQ